MSFGALGLAPIFGSAFLPYDYLTDGPGLYALRTLATDVVSVLLSGKRGDLEFAGDFFRTIEAAPEVSAVFGGSPGEAALLGQTVLSTLIQEQRETPAQIRLTVKSLASVLIDDIVDTMKHGGDPAACLIDFQNTFNDWANLASVVQVPKSVSRTGWCEKDIAFPSSGGKIASCKAAALCRTGMDAQGNLFVYEAPPPDPTDIRPPVSASTSPLPLPTHADIEASVHRTMAERGETVQNLEYQAEFGELAAYLESLTDAKRWVRLALDLPANATDHAISVALGKLGISPGEASDWFLGCNFDAECFRFNMNHAIAEAKSVSTTDRVKAVAVVGAMSAAAYGLYLIFGRR